MACCLTLHRYGLSKRETPTFGLLRSNKEYRLKTAVFSKVIECQDFE